MAWLEEVLEDSPVAAWGDGVTDDGDWEDEAGREDLHLTPAGNATRKASGGPGAGLKSCWSLDGNGDYLFNDDDTRIGHPFDLSDSFTVEIWAKRDGDPGDWAALFSKGDLTAYQARLTASPQDVQFDVRDGFNNEFIVASNVFPNDTWTHFAFVFDFGVLEIFVNGESKGADAFFVSPGWNDFPFVVGAQSETDGSLEYRRFFRGDVAGVAMFDYALSGQRIAAHYEATLIGGEPTPTETSISQGLLLTQSAAVSQQVKTEVDQGLLLSQDVAAEATAAAEVQAFASQGLLLTQSAAVSQQVKTEVDQGLRLTQAVSASAQQVYPSLAETLAEVFALRQAHYGPVDDKTAPDGATVISPTSYAELKAAIEGGSENEVFWLTTLVRPTHSDLESAQHTENGVTVDRNYVPRISPRNGQEIHCAPGAGYDGRVELTGWIEDNGVWYVTGQTQRLRRADTPPVDAGNDGFKFPHYAEQVWFDGEWLTQVGSLAELKPGTFFFGYGDPGELTEDMRDESLANRIYIAQDPTGHTVETNLTDGAFRGPNQFDRTFSIHNAIIEGHGNPFQTGAVEGSGVLLKNCRVNHNAGGAAILNNSSLMQGCQFNYNGQAGPGASGGDGALVESEVGFNNQKNGNSLWWAHAVKPTFMDSWLYRKVWCHDNNSSGLCSDVSNKNIEWDRCLSENNAGHGIVHEIGYNFSIHNNIAIYNGWGSWTQYWAHRVGIVIVNSQNGEVTQNFAMHNLGGQIHRVQDTRMVDVNNDPELGPWILQNTSVHHNVMGAAEGNQFEQYLSGFDIHPGVANRGDYVTSMGNTSDHNTYLPPPNLENLALFFFPDPTYVADPDNLHLHYTFSQWQSAGFDTNGTIDAWSGDDVFFWARQGLLLTQSATAAAEVQASASQGLLLTHAVTTSTETSASLAHGVLLSQDVAATVTAEVSASHGLLLTHSVAAEAVVESTVTEGLLLTPTVAVDLEVQAAVAQGLLLSQDVTAVQVEEPSATPVEAALVQGLTLTHDAAVSMTLAASVSQGLLLSQDAAVLAGDPVAATIAQGLALYQQVATQAEVSAQLAHGLHLTQSVSASSDPAPAIAQGFLLAQAVQASLLVTAAAAHGIVITQDVRGVNHVDVEASIAQGILIRHRVRVGKRSGGDNLATFGRLLRP